jgi:hypothetical protein
MADPFANFNISGNRMRSWLKRGKARPSYNNLETRTSKFLNALRSKTAATNRFKGKFQYVADFFRYASVDELIKVYEKLKTRKGHTTEYASIINSELNPGLKDTPTAFFKAFEKLYKQHANAEQRLQNFISTGVTRSQKKTHSARRMLYVYVMKYEDVDPSYFINVLFKAIPGSYEQGNPSNLSPMSRKKRSSQ